VIKKVKVFVAMKRKLAVATRWPAPRLTKGWCPASCRKKTCLFCRRHAGGHVLTPGGTFPHERGQVLETPHGLGLPYPGKQIGEWSDSLQSGIHPGAAEADSQSGCALAAEIDSLTYEELRDIWQKHYHDGIHMASRSLTGLTKMRSGLPGGGRAANRRPVAPPGRSQRGGSNGM